MGLAAEQEDILDTPTPHPLDGTGLCAGGVEVLSMAIHASHHCLSSQILLRYQSLHPTLHALPLLGRYTIL